MKQKIRNILLKISIWACAMPMVIFFMVMTFMLIPRLQLLLGHMQLLDTMSNGYNASYVHQLLEKFRSEGREAYLSLELYADIPFIFLYVITFTVSITKLLVKNGLWNSALFYSLLFPILAGAFDLGEDIGIISMLISENEISASIIKLTSCSTILKGVFLPLTLLTLFSQLGLMGYRKLKLKNKTSLIR
ncbi:hypothetical protein L3C95_08715 [Chitinophaga filiformis]|uniref:hypothetical protein n=1 Tax=Chitinophaga filiformis TaxID=104663 RepID=UPI001F45052A|nr:hypothetical protein [Chitinophaga filiformis]MCF6402952.1 hypothetical protein [Chitinophaga filiformis]